MWNTDPALNPSRYSGQLAPRPGGACSEPSAGGLPIRSRPTPHPRARELRRWQAQEDPGPATQRPSPRQPLPGPHSPAAQSLSPGARRPRGATPAPRPRAPANILPRPAGQLSPLGRTYPGAVVAHHHLPALAVHRPPGREPPLPPPNYLRPPPGSFLFLLRPLCGPSLHPTFFPQPEVPAQPRRSCRTSAEKVGPA